MKKTLFALTLLICGGLLSGCGNTATAEAPESEAVSATENAAPEEGIDYDLTTMSSTMIYASG